ncbi:MAG: hypothetical protein ACPGWR_01540 [Ardenticatenaceae bacterium]
MTTVESADLKPYQKIRLLPVEDYYEFVQQLNARVATDTFSFLFLSDGFQRAFARISERTAALGLSAQQRPQTQSENL